MKEYKTIEIRRTGSETEDMLNFYARSGWKVVCSYAYNGNWIILERDKGGKK